MTDSSWLIEATPALYWNGQGSAFEYAFTPDHEMAIRFTRQSDANRVIQWLQLSAMARYYSEIFPILRATEHVWLDNSPPPALQEERSAEPSEYGCFEDYVRVRDAVLQYLSAFAIDDDMDEATLLADAIRRAAEKLAEPVGTPEQGPVAEDAMPDSVNVPLRTKLMWLLSDVAQLLDGWHQDGTAWSAWDEAVRQQVSEALQALHHAGGAKTGDAMPEHIASEIALAHRMTALGAKHGNDAPLEIQALLWLDSDRTRLVEALAKTKADADCGWDGRRALEARCSRLQRERDQLEQALAEKEKETALLSNAYNNAHTYYVQLEQQLAQSRTELGEKIRIAYMSGWNDGYVSCQVPVPDSVSEKEADFQVFLNATTPS